MATKNLARTVIEGGRYRFNKFERHYSNRRARREARLYTHVLCHDDDVGEGSAVPRRTKVYRMHYDRLNAAERWLASMIGRPWDEVRSRIARSFNTRTIAGQHIVFDHLLPSVSRGAIEPFPRHRPFF
ncbi:MAG: hypothetical protein AAGC55_09780, partial [Myxococcota bacterium]